jgi:hypothetical protein
VSEVIGASEVVFAAENDVVAANGCRWSVRALRLRFTGGPLIHVEVFRKRSLLRQGAGRFLCFPVHPCFVGVPDGENRSAS